MAYITEFDRQSVIRPIYYLFCNLTIPNGYNFYVCDIEYEFFLTKVREYLFVLRLNNFSFPQLKTSNRIYSSNPFHNGFPV